MSIKIFTQKDFLDHIRQHGEYLEVIINRQKDKQFPLTVEDQMFAYLERALTGVAKPDSIEAGYAGIPVSISSDPDIHIALKSSLNAKPNQFFRLDFDRNHGPFLHEKDSVYILTPLTDEDSKLLYKDIYGFV